MSFWTMSYYPYGIIFMYSLMGFLIGVLHLFKEWRKTKDTASFGVLSFYVLFYVVAVGQLILMG